MKLGLISEVKCAQLGPIGAALSIIAVQLRELTGETMTAANLAGACLKDASGLALAFAKGSAGEGAGRIGALEQEAQRALDLLSSLDGKLAGALRLLESDGPAIANALRGAASALGVQSEITEFLDDVRVKLTEQSNAPLAPYSTGLDALLVPIAKSYTMEVERDIHRRVFGKLPDSLSAQSADTKPAMDDIDFLL